MTMCEKYEWCDIDHNDAVEESLESPHVWHRATIMDEEQVGVLRTDFLLNPEGPALSICETTDWEIPVDAAPEYFAKMRKHLDEVEQRFNDFVTETGRRNCERPGCVAGTHTWSNGLQDDHCRMAALSSGDGAWSVQSYYNADSGLWEVFADAPGSDGFEGLPGLTGLKAAVAAFEAAQKDCDLLNEGMK